MRTSRAQVLAMGCIFIVAIFLFVMVVVNVGRFQIERSRTMTRSQLSVLGAVRLRAEALARVAQRWEIFGQKVGPVDTGGRVFVRSSDKAAVSSNAQTLIHSLPGYQGRTTSIVSVLAQSNDISRSVITVEDSQGARLDISAQPAVVFDESAIASVIEGLWYRRGWTRDQDEGNPGGVVRHRVAFSVGALTALSTRWSSSVSATACLRWDRSEAGNGGFPRDWNSALLESRLNPHRTASYRAVLLENTP